MSRPLQRGSGARALHVQLALRLRRQIRERLITPGTRLASVRGCAREHGVHPQTVVAAYDLLQAQGLIEPRPRLGFFVRDTRLLHARIARTPPESRDARPEPPLHALALLRGALADTADAPGMRSMPGCGHLPATWLQAAPLAQAMRRLLRDGGFEETARHHGCPQGDPRLRRLLSRELAELEVPAPAAGLLLCLGATQALDLVARTLARPGDAVMVEQPGPALAFAQFARCGLRLLGVPRRADGLDLQRVRHWARTRRPRLMLVGSRLHDPTGAQLGSACAHQLLELAREHDFLIVEDDSCAALCDQPTPLLTAMDGLRRTLLVGSFSRLLAPGWRVGYLAAPAALSGPLCEAKLLAGLGTPALVERALALLLERGALRRQAACLRERLARARRHAVQQALQHGCRFDAAPRGLFGWVDTGVDTERLALGLHARGHLLAPGRLFDPQARPSTRMRLNFAHAQDPGFWADYASALRECAG